MNSSPNQEETPSDEPEIEPALADMLALAVSARPPESLWDGVHARATEQRGFGTGPPLGPNDTIDPVDGYERAIEEIVTLGSEIDGAQWDLASVNGWTVKGLYAHLAVVEQWFGWRAGLCGPDVFGPDEQDHVAFTAPAMHELLRREPGEIVAELHRRAQVVTQGLRRFDAADWDRVLRFYAFEGPLSGNVVARIFELWIHYEDVLRALGRPLAAPDPGRLRMMSTVASALLGPGMALAGLPTTGRRARLVLTGPGGGTFVSELDPHAHHSGAPRRSVTVVADVAEFCRVVARRLPIDALDMIVEGDTALARDVLVGASMLAAD